MVIQFCFVPCREEMACGPVVTLSRSHSVNTIYVTSTSLSTSGCKLLPCIPFPPPKRVFSRWVWGVCKRISCDSFLKCASCRAVVFIMSAFHSSRSRESGSCCLCPCCLASLGFSECEAQENARKGENRLGILAYFLPGPQSTPAARA